MACTLTTSALVLTNGPLSKRAARRAAAAVAPGRVQPRRQRSVVTAAAGKPEQPSSGAVQDLARSAERVLARYDFLSAGMGALLVTGFCVARGQDVGTALWITAAATVVALLVNDVLPEEE